MKNKKYDCVVSIGEACACAMVLKRNCLRDFSGPFDWCYGASLPQRIDLILNNFSYFFNREDFVSIYSPENWLCNIYKNTKTNIIHNHDFDKKKSFDDAFAEASSKYKRRTTRLLSFLKSDKKILFVYLKLPSLKDYFPDWDRVELQTDEEIISSFNALKEKYPNAHLLYVRHNKNLKDKEVVYKELTSDCFLAECYNLSRRIEKINPDGNNYNRKNMQAVLSFIKTDKQLNLRFKQIIRKIKRIFYKNNPNKKYKRILFFKIKNKGYNKNARH